jgi:adenylate cyclase
VIGLGIGLHAGEAFCGAVGDETRLEFTVLGDTVNIVAPLEQETKAVGLSLVVSRAFLAAAGERVDGRNWQQLGVRTLRGRAQPVDLLGTHPFGVTRRRTNSPESQLGSCAGDGYKMRAF